MSEKRPPLSSFLQKQKEEASDDAVIAKLRGTKGEKGDQGVAGKDGIDGKDGLDGKDGVDGKQGTKGERGESGLKGDAGTTPSLEELEAIVLPLIPDVEIPELQPKDLIEKINKAKTVKIKRERVEGFDEIEGLAKSANRNVQNILSLGGSRQTAIKVSGTLLGTGINTINFVGATGTKIGDGSEVNVTTSGSGSGVVQTIVAGTGITVNSTDPANPIVSATGTGTPGGSTTQLQYNNAGAFGGISRITTNGNDLILTGQTSPTYTQGKLVYDTDNESLTFYNNDSNISLQIGQEQWLKVINKTGSTIANGAAVYVNGVDATTGLQTIALAKGDAAATIIGAGLTTESIVNNAIGYVTVIGVVHGLDTSGFTAGATVFISATTAGALTSTAPTAPNYRYRIGIVGMSSATVGTINVTPSTAALGNGTANQVFGINNAGTAQEVKSIVAGANITVTNTANTITIAATGGGTGTVTSVTSADANATVATTTTTPVITIVSAPKLTTARTIGIATGDATSAGSTFDGSANNTNALTLATVNANTGSFGSATAAPSFTVNGKGLITAAGTNTITPAVGSITGLGTGVATFLATPSSANLATAVTDETGSGALVFATSPTLTTAVLGSSTATTQSPSDNSTKVATTAYVDAAVLGQNFKEAALVATTANLVGVYLAGVFTYTATGTDNIDGVNLALGNRVLVKNQTTTFQNGIYSVTTAGSLGVAGVLTRSSDANTSGEFKTGDALFVTSGTVNASTTWAYTGVDSPTLGTDAITYVQIAGLGTFVAGNGLTLTGNSFSIDTSITVDKTTAQTLTNKSIAATQLTGTLQAGQFPALTGDITTSAGALATTLATVNSNVGSFTNASITVNGKGLITAASNGTAPVTSVAGTTNRITVTGTTSAVVDIAATYVGQSSITTLGTITTGVWTGTTIAVANGGTGVTSVTTAPAATAFAGWDANKNLSANNFLEGFTTTATAAGTTVLTVASTETQQFTGSTTQIVTLPTTSIVAGTKYHIENSSTGIVTVNASGGALVFALAPGTSAIYTALIATPTTAANWFVTPVSAFASTGKIGLFTNSLTLSGTDGTTLTFQGTDTYVGRTTTDTLTNKRITRRTTTVTQAAAPTINSDNMDVAAITGLAQAITSMTTNLTGTPVQNDFLELQITDNGTARGITWGTSFSAGGLVALPTTTVISTKLRVLFEWDATTKWTCVAIA